MAALRAPFLFPRLFLGFPLFLSLAIVTQAEPPTLEHLYPAGGGRGSSNVVTVTGKFEPWPPQVWCSDSSLSIQPETNKGKLVISVPRDTLPGPRLIRLFNEQGASEVRAWVVGNNQEISDTETNNHFLRPQRITQFPVTINGRLDRNGDVDSFAFSLEQGEYLDASVDGYSLASKLDAVLRLTTTNGVQLAWNHDFISLDPRLRWTAPSNQPVVLQIFGFPHPANAEVRLFGGEGAVYRLHLEKGTGNPPPLIGGTSPAPEKLKAPARLIGRIQDPTAELKYPFTSGKDQYWQAEVEAARLGSPLDAWLKIEDAAGKELARNDDAEGSRDPILEWKAPDAGEYRLVLGSVTHRAGEAFQYALNWRKAKPDYKVQLVSGSLVATPGSTNQVKFNLKRFRGHTNEIQIKASGLPEQATFVSTNAPAKGGEFSTALQVGNEATNRHAQVRFFARESGSNEERPILFRLTSRTEDNGVPGGFTHLMVEEVDHLWMTVYRKK